MLPLPETQSKQHFVSVHPFESGHMHCPQNIFISGLSGEAHVPSWRFLVSHKTSNTKLWFDLGMSTDLADYPPAIQAIHQKMFNATPAVNTLADDLKSLNLSGNDIKFVIASHAHWDHIFPAKQFLPNAKPATEDSHYDERIWNPQAAELPISELPSPVDEPEKWTSLGTFDRAYDFFGDGSFYVIDSPGHMTGNLSALCRTKTRDGQLRWILLGGDCLHSTQFLQNPEAPFGHIPQSPSGCIEENPEVARDTIRRISALKVSNSRVLVWLAHAGELECEWEFAQPS
ncbi:Beta-lactamase-like protein [Akanthomyces lecanii RCEF 1005]|uniref:Beta-lactamase-like protein n=1 Tax=Akanthomyces lecanii RCEF 1005 TaxID=1081108 RepID=A0A168FAJ8_CORDF|nr:Beta-lactamase-like protein [Akanthomyces lecanii RCEF 1005]